MKNELNFVVIGKQIKNRRRAMGVTQEQLANYLDVNPSHISNIETGRARPSLVALINIAIYLKCSVDTFISSEYGFDLDTSHKNKRAKTVLETQLERKLKSCDEKTLEKILKIVDII